VFKKWGRGLGTGDWEGRRENGEWRMENGGSGDFLGGIIFVFV
jgi:hypothetical protein